MDSAGEQPRQENTERRPRQRGWLIGGAVVAGLMVLTVGALVLVVALGTGERDRSGPAAAPPTYQEEYVSGEGPDKVAVIPVVGLISPAESNVSGTVPLSTPDGLRNALRQAAEDDAVVGVLLEVNSPGGGVTASDQMHRLIEDFKSSSDKPVVVSLGTTAASGGYYIATAADDIVTEPTALTGSLGAIIQLPDLSGTADKVGFEQEVIKSGEFKDMGSSFRDLSPEEREIFESIVDESYDRFVQVIVEGRNLSEQRVREVADGRVYTGEQAVELDLADELGGLEEAAEITRQKADVEEATVVRYTRPPGLSGLLRLFLEPQEPSTLQLLEATGLHLKGEPLYLYLPGT